MTQNTEETKTKNYTEVKIMTVNDIVDALADKSEKKYKIEIPKYQRNLVWSEDQKDAFIDSVKRGFPIGSLLLYGIEDKKNIFSLTDGLQRASTLLAYKENPNSFFKFNGNGILEKEMLEKSLKIIKPKYKDIDERLLENTIVDWVKSRKGFEESNEYSATYLAEEIEKKLLLRFQESSQQELTKEIKNKLQFSREEMTDLRKILEVFTYSVKKESDIFNFQIPVIIYTGVANTLPEIFERLNKQGTQLTKYQIYAASWANHKLKIKNNAIIDQIRQKYEALTEKGLKIENFIKDDKEAFYKEYFSAFEYLLGLGKYLVEKYPTLFDKSKKEEESISFNLASICLGSSIKSMDKFQVRLLEIQNFKKDQSVFEKALFDSIDKTLEILKPYISLKANKQRTSKKPVIYHSEYQIISIIGKIFRSKYDEKTLEVRTQYWKDIEKKLSVYIPFHYLYEILEGSWRSSGDAIALTKSDNNHYELAIPRNKWEFRFEEWFKMELEKKEKQRAKINDVSVLFLKYIYTHLLTAHEELSAREFEIEHLVPVDRLKKLSKDNNDGIPMSAIANLCLIDKKLNREKGSLTFYEYYEQNKNSDKKNKAKLSLEEMEKIEKLTFTSEEDLEFVENKDFTFEDYNDFLQNRFETLKTKFFELNKIV